MKMHRTIRGLALLWTCLLSGCITPDVGPAISPHAMPSDFRSIVQEATGRVFPCVVYI